MGVRVEYDDYLRNILAFYIPLLVQLPSLRDNPDFMEEQVKAMGKDGITDVVTQADIYIQKRIKNQVQSLYPNWQFWGEEGEDKNKNLDYSKEYFFITDPIEGTNNFRFYKDEFWGSVIGLVDMKTQEPVIGLVAQPKKQRIFVGIKGQGAYVVSYNDGSEITEKSPMKNKPEHDLFTYNNSPHFEKHLMEQVNKFFQLGEVLPDEENGNNFEKSRKTILIPFGDKKVKFVDVECGALEPMLFRGVIMFKTNIEMAAVFVIIKELGGIIIDKDGQSWSINTNSLIFARNKSDRSFLKDIYERTT